MLYEIRFRLSRPLIVDDPIHFDAVLTAVHPEAGGPVDTLRAIREKRLADLPLPIKKVRCDDDWIWAASTIDLSSDAVPFSGKYSKRKDMNDARWLEKNLMVIGGVFKDAVSDAAGYVCSAASFLAETDDVESLALMCGRVSHLGRLRGMGYGVVSGMEIAEAPEQDWRLTLVREGRAVRNLPESFVDGGCVAPVRIRPPYWGHLGMRQPGVTPGESITLRAEVSLC